MNTYFQNFYASRYKVYIFLFSIPLLLYAKSFFYPFSPMDETWLINGNTMLLKDWSSLLDSFKGNIQKVYYRPLLIDSFIVDYHLGELNPFVYHLSNLIFHLFCVFLLHRFLLLLKVEHKPAFFLTLLFAIHPLNVHAVAWVPGRNDMLLCMFTLLGAISLIKYHEHKKKIFLVLHFLTFTAALLVKESAISLPLVFLLLHLMLSRKKTSLLIFGCLWALGIALWFFARQKVLDHFSVDFTNYIAASIKFILSLIIFSGKSILPLQQSVSPVIHNSPVWLNLGLLLVFIFLVYKFGLKNKQLAWFGVAMFYILLFFPVWFGAQTTLGEQYEHRAYVPLIGIIILVSQIKFDYTSRILQIFFSMLLIFFTIKTVIRQDTYKNEISFLDEGINDCPENYFFHSQKGILLYFDKDLNGALACMNQAIAIYPNQAKLYNNRGNVHLELNHKEETIADYSKALELSDKKSSVYMARFMAYKKFGEFEKAKKDMEDIQKMYPDLISAEIEKEVQVAWYSERITHLTDSITIHPNKANFYVERAMAFFYKRKGHEALADLKKACELEPDNKQYKAYYEKLNSTFPH